MTDAVTVNEGDGLMLACKVNGARGQLSVAWQHKSHTGGFSNIIGLNQEGVVENSLAGRSVTAARPATDTFTLKLKEVTPADAGVYQCDVSEWRTNSKTISQTQSTSVTVTPIGKLYTLEKTLLDIIIVVVVVILLIFPSCQVITTPGPNLSKANRQLALKSAKS